MQKKIQMSKKSFVYLIGVIILEDIMFHMIEKIKRQGAKNWEVFANITCVNSNG